MKLLKEILDKLAVDCGEEYHRLHSGEQDFDLTNAHMNYYEKEAMKQIVKLFPATKTIRLPAVKQRSGDYDKGYNSGYIAGKRAKLELPQRNVADRKPSKTSKNAKESL